MRVALLHPTYWPEVRRGAERLVHDAAVALTGRGHEVTIITSHRAPRRASVEAGIRVIRNRRPPSGFLDRRQYEPHLANVPAAARELVSGDYEMAHAFFLPDAWAAAMAHRFRGPPFVFSVTGLPTRRSIVSRRWRLELLESVTRSALATTVLSEAAQALFRRYMRRVPAVLPGGVFCADFSVEVERRPEPTFVCAASLADPRKRGEVLVRAFERLRRRRPGARLLLAARRSELPGRGGSTLPAGVEWVNADDTAALAAIYASSWVSVLPAVEEAFGLVLVESLAAGTPAVAARSGGCSEILATEEVGRLFRPDEVDDLARAMEEALELSTDPATERACRARARDFDWGPLAARYERIYAPRSGQGSIERGHGHERGSAHLSAGYGC